MTEMPQRPGDRLEVDLGRTETVAAVALDIGYPHEEFGRNLVAGRWTTATGWQRVPYADGPAERLATLDDLLRAAARGAHGPAHRGAAGPAACG